jgi:calcineurin-like phosphoesterase family protein
LKPDEYISADLHLGHANLIKYGARDFKDCNEMDRVIIDNWNSVINRNTAVYILGDLVICNKRQAARYLKQLNGRKRLVIGNHDSVIKGELLKYFEWVKPYYESRTEDRTKVVMCHYPFLTWNKSHYGSWMLHGHSHGSLTVLPGRRMDVGIDTHPEFRPYSFTEIQIKMQELGIGVHDHHKLRTR